MLRSFLSGLGDLVYPPLCFSCHVLLDSAGRHGQICPSCLRSIQQHRKPACPKCSRFLGQEPSSRLCSSCTQFNPAFDFAWSACPYEEPLRRLIHQYKFHKQIQLRKVFSRIMLEYVTHCHLDIHQFDIIIPIPLHASKYRERGYNQAALLGKIIAREKNILYLQSLLHRSRPTAPQASLNRKNRFTNIQGSFKINPSHHIIDKNILIIDDLLTTGATASTAALCLKAHGAATIGVLTLAIA